MATELREVKIEEYWPLIVKNTAEFGQIAVAENPEFNNLAKCIYQVLCDGFIDEEMSEYGVSRWESMLGITPPADSSLDDRKAAILTQLSVKIPYTWRVLKQMLVPILGGEDKFEMEYVNDEGKLVLHTDRLDDAMLATVDELLSRVLPQNIEVARYNHHIEISWRDINKYANFRNNTEIMAFASLETIQNDLTSDGEWCYPMTMFSNRFVKRTWFLGLKNDSDIFYANKARKITLIAPNALLGEGAMTNSLNLEEVYVESKYNEMPYVFEGCRKLKKAVVKGGAANWIGKICYNCTSLEEVDITMGDNGHNFELAFHGCKLNKASALRMLGQMTKKMTWWYHNAKKAHYGIHVDHQKDPEVLAAIAAAEENEWEMTVQWNGTPTSGISTMDLEEIWCKVTEDEHGEYTDENDNRCQLEWGHYVTDTSAYKLFFSLVEAEQYFKLTKVNENE